VFIGVFIKFLALCNPLGVETCCNSIKNKVVVMIYIPLIIGNTKGCLILKLKLHYYEVTEKIVVHH